MIKKLRVNIITIFILFFLLAILLLLFSNITDLTFEIINDKETLIISTNNSVTKIENIYNFFNNKKSNLAEISEINELDFEVINYLKQLQFSDDDINSMSVDDIQTYTNSINAQVANSTYISEEILDNGTKTHSKITITTRLFRTPQYDTDYKAYRMEAEAYWDKSPSYRLKDILAIACTNGTVYGKSSNGQRLGNLSYYVNYTTGGSKSHSYNAPHEKIEELSENPPLFAYRANLPNDLIGIGASNLCHGIRVSLKTLIYNNNHFNVYTAYGHKLVGLKATVSLKGWDIKFNTACDKFDGIMLSSI